MSRAALSLNEGNTRRYCGERIKAGWSYVKETLKGSTGNWITFVLWIISVSLDPYICYVPSIDDEKKLLKINSSLKITLWVFYFSLLIYRIFISFCVYKGNLQKFNLVESMALIFSNVLLYSLVLIPKMETSAPVFTVVSGFFLVACLMRVIGIYKKFTSTSSKLGEASHIKIGFNFILFVYGCHIFGGLWYFLAIWKKLVCWRNVCLEHDHQICHYTNNRFHANPEGNKLLNDNCFAKIEDTYELGIFKDAFESRIVETSNTWKKMFYCFRWGIQNISGFGTNLQVSTNTWENIFVVLIAIYGLGTFTIFIGNMQNLLNSAINSPIEERRKKADQEIKQQLQQWFTFGKISKNLQNRIKQQLHQYNGQQTGVVDVKNLFCNLREDVRNKFKHQLCSELKKKVERFKRWGDTSLLHLCYCIKPVVYDELTLIVREGDPINEMLFVLHGKLWNFSKAASSTNKVPPLDRRKEILKDGDFWGEELVNWVHQDFFYESSSSLSSKILISHTTIKALTKVEAFVLRIDDLKKLFNEKAKILQSWFRKRKKRDRWMELLSTIKSNREQTPPGDQLTGPEIDV